MEILGNCFFGSLPGCIAQGLSSDRTCEVDEITEGNTSGTHRKNSYYCIYSQMFKTYQRGTNLFEFSQNTNREVLKMRKNDVTCQ